MRSYLFLLLLQIHLFWKARAALSFLVFHIHRIRFGIKCRIGEMSTSTGSVLLIFRSVLAGLIMASILAILFQVTNPYFMAQLEKIGLPIPSATGYRTLLTTFTSIGGIFIGFYFAAISTVCGAIYARVPNNIRELLIHERVGSAYMSFLAAVTFLGLFLLTFQALGWGPVALAIPLVAVSGGVMIFGFVRLGARAFYLFDPTALSGHLLNQLQRCYLQVKAGGHRWAEEAFQHHAHQTARTALDTLVTVSDITAKEPQLCGRPFARLCQGLLAFLCNYEKARKSIPTQSLWYGKRYTHPDWYRARDTETSLGHQTAMGLQPQSVSEARWIESVVYPILECCLRANIRNGQYDTVNELLEALDQYIRLLAEEHAVDYAFNLISDVFSWCREPIFAREDAPVQEESLEKMAVADRLARLPITVLLAYVGTIEPYGGQEILRRIQKIDWRSEKSIYKAGFCTSVLASLEWMRPRLEFEERIEGRVVSPLWYLQGMVNLREAENLRDAMDHLYTRSTEIFRDWIGVALSSQHPWLAAVIVSVESEYWKKLGHHTQALSRLWVDLKSSSRVEDLEWPNLDMGLLQKAKAERETELLRLIADQATSPSLTTRNEEVPDFAGRFLHTIGEALFDAMCENDFRTFEELFGSFFVGCSLESDRLRSSASGRDWQAEREAKVAVAPLLDLMEISGYAYLFSEYHASPRLREIVETSWDKCLEKHSADGLIFFAIAVCVTESSIEIPHRGINRTRWKQIVQQRLAGVAAEGGKGGEGLGLDDYVPTVAHDSALVRLFVGRMGYVGFDGIDIFIGKYVRLHEEGRELDFGRRRRRDIQEAIDRESRRSESSNS